MTDIRKYIKAVNVFLVILVLGTLTIHLFLSKYINILSLVINIVVIGIILLITILCWLIYGVGKVAGEIETLEKMKKYIEESKDWNEFMDKISVDFNENNIEV